MSQTGFYFDQTRCTGCYTCVVACKDWHDIPAGPASLIRLNIIEEGRFPNLFVAYLASPCYHCEDPPCIRACPADAIYKRDSDGIVLVDRERCLGKAECGMLCLKACPWDAPQFGIEEDAKMQKCDLCFKRLEQGKQAICVEACPMYALDVGPLGELRARYGEGVEAEGYRYSRRARPSVVLKARPQGNDDYRSDSPSHGPENTFNDVR